jgi:hypothetical protein
LCLEVEPGGTSPAPTKEKEKAPWCWPRRRMKRYKLTSFA